MGKKPASLWPVCSHLKATSAINWAGQEHLENPCHQGLNINSIPFRTHAVFNLNDSTHFNSHVALAKPSMKLKNTGQLLSDIMTSRRIMDYMDYIHIFVYLSFKCMLDRANWSLMNFQSVISPSAALQNKIICFSSWFCYLCRWHVVRCKKVIKQQI